MAEVIRCKVADVDTVMPEWRGLEARVLSLFDNAYGSKYFHVELPILDHNGKSISVLLSASQITITAR